MDNTIGFYPMNVGSIPAGGASNASVVKLANTPGLSPDTVKGLRVQVPPLAPFIFLYKW